MPVESRCLRRRCFRRQEGVAVAAIVSMPVESRGLAFESKLWNPTSHVLQVAVGHVCPAMCLPMYLPQAPHMSSNH